MQGSRVAQKLFPLDQSGHNRHPLRGLPNPADSNGYLPQYLCSVGQRLMHLSYLTGGYTEGYTFV